MTAAAASSAHGPASRNGGRRRRNPRRGAESAPSALNLAWKALEALNTPDAPEARTRTAQEALDAVLRAAPGADPRDRSLAAELLYGCLRREILLNRILGTVLRRPDRLPPALRLLLLLGCYGLVVPDRLPDHAVIFQAAELARARFGEALSRVANGALRSVQRLGGAVLEPEFCRDPGESADDPAVSARRFSLPEYVFRLWLDAWGMETALLLARRSLERPAAALRVNASRPGAPRLRELLLAEEGAVAAGAWGVALPGGTRPAEIGGRPLDDLLAEGLLTSQAAGSQWILEELLGDGAAAGDGAPVWDACCGHGGKSAALAERGRKIVLCSDVSRRRLSRLPGLFSRLGLAVPPHVLADALRPPTGRMSGVILMDAPCSGLGVLSRRPDIRRRPPERLAELPKLQIAMARALAGRLAPGGRLIHMTCTLNPAENEAVAAALERDGLILRAAVTTPHDHPFMEGMFGALLERR